MQVKMVYNCHKTGNEVNLSFTDFFSCRGSQFKEKFSTLSGSVINVLLIDKQRGNLGLKSPKVWRIFSKFTVLSQPACWGNRYSISNYEPTRSSTETRNQWHALLHHEYFSWSTTLTGSGCSHVAQKKRVQIVDTFQHRFHNKTINKTGKCQRFEANLQTQHFL